MSDEVTEEGTVATEAKAPKEKAPSKKVALPEGYVTPVDFAKQLSERNGEEVRPQVVYGYVKNMKEFPFVERDEAPRFMVKVPEAFDFLATKLAEKAAKKAAKAEADAAKASAPAEAPAE